MKIKLKCKVRSLTANTRHRTCNSEKGIALPIVLMVMVILLLVTGTALNFTGKEIRISSSYRSGTQAFYAADMGINVGLSQLTLNQTTATAAFSNSLPGGLVYRSGRRTASGPQPLQFLGTRIASEGYSIGSGTGYNTAGYIFHAYQINATGTGPVGSAREIEAQGEYGPIPQ